MPRIGRGGVANFIDATVADGAGNLVDADATPLIDIIDADDVQVVTDQAAEHTGTGLYRFPSPGYSVPVNAALGSWRVHWTTVVNGAAVTDDDFFEVVAAGSIAFPPDTAAGGVCSLWATADLMPCDLEGVDEDLIDDALATASSILYVLSGRQFPGVCEETIRPCALRVDTPRHRRYGWGEWSWREEWWGCGCRSNVACGCASMSQIELRTPVAEVSLVSVDGIALDPGAYRVDDWKWLVRVDGDAWPCCQSLELESTEPDTFEVTYTFGTPPSPGGDRSAAALACELVKAWSPETAGECRLPQRVQQLVRQGVTMVFDPATVFDNGLTGISEVDLWLRSVNPKVDRGRTVICSPDVPPVRWRHVGT